MLLWNIYKALLRYEAIKKVVDKEEDEYNQKEELKKDAKKYRILYGKEHYERK